MHYIIYSQQKSHAIIILNIQDIHKMGTTMFQVANETIQVLLFQEKNFNLNQ